MEVNGRPVHFIVETLQKGYAYSCTPEDICRNLSAVPPVDLQGLDLIVFRQPKTKEVALDSCWGRLVYDFPYKNIEKTTIILEAVDVSRVLRFKKALTTFYMREMELLEKEGHTITDTGRHYEIRSTLEAARNTQLYRTLFHETGHYFDHIHGASNNPADKEAFAEHYAKRMQERLHRIMESNSG